MPDPFHHPLATPLPPFPNITHRSA